MSCPSEPIGDGVPSGSTGCVVRCGPGRSPDGVVAMPSDTALGVEPAVAGVDAVVSLVGLVAVGMPVPAAPVPARLPAP